MAITGDGEITNVNVDNFATISVAPASVVCISMALLLARYG